MGKTLHNSDISGTHQNVPDVVVFGDGDAWKLLCKASSENEGWMKSTKAMPVGTGCLVQVTTQQRNPDGSWSLAEALTFVKDVEVIDVDDPDGGPVLARYLAPMDYVAYGIKQLKASVPVNA